MRASIWATCCAFVLWFAGCGGTTNSGGTSSASTARTYCEAETAWRERCKNQTCGTTAVACLPDVPCPPPEPNPCNVNNLMCDPPGMPACLERIFRPEALEQMKECELTLACDGGREHCAENITFANPLPSALAFQTECEARQQECVGQITGSDGDFFCFDLSANTDEYVSIYRDCLAETCNAIRGCMDRGKFDSFCAM